MPHFFHPETTCHTIPMLLFYYDTPVVEAVLWSVRFESHHCLTVVVVKMNMVSRLVGYPLVACLFLSVLRHSDCTHKAPLYIFAVAVSMTQTPFCDHWMLSQTNIGVESNLFVYLTCRYYFMYGFDWPCSDVIYCQLERITVSTLF
jgi:hypothetical protein